MTSTTKTISGIVSYINDDIADDSYAWSGEKIANYVAISTGGSAAQDLLSGTDNTYDIGSTGDRWAEIHGTSIYTSSINDSSANPLMSAGVTGLNFHEDLIPGNANINIGAVLYPFDQIYTNSIRGDGGGGSSEVKLEFNTADQITVGRSLIPVVNNTLALGGATLAYIDTFSKTVNTDTIKDSSGVTSLIGYTGGNLVFGADIGATGSNVGNVWANNLRCLNIYSTNDGAKSIDISATDTISLTGNVLTADSSNLGSSSVPWVNTYSTYVNTSAVRDASGNSVFSVNGSTGLQMVGTNIVTTSSTSNIGTTGTPFGNVSASTVNTGAITALSTSISAGTLVPNSTSKTLGTTGSPWASLYVKEVNAWAYYQWSGDADVHTGYEQILNASATGGILSNSFTSYFTPTVYNEDSADRIQWKNISGRTLYCVISVTRPMGLDSSTAACRLGVTPLGQSTQTKFISFSYGEHEYLPAGTTTGIALQCFTLTTFMPVYNNHYLKLTAGLSSGTESWRYFSQAGFFSIRIIGTG